MKTGESSANLLEIASVLSVSIEHKILWKKNSIDPSLLARKRWVDGWSLDKISAELGYGRTAVVRHLSRLKANPDLIEDGKAHSHAKSRKHRFMGSR